MHFNQLTTDTLETSELDIQTIPIVCAADDRYAMQLATVVCSVLANLSTDKRLLLFVIDGGISESNKDRILKSINQTRCMVQWLTPSYALLKDMKISGHVSVAAYFRLLIPDLLPLHFNKVIYLDCDLVVNENIDKLWKINLAENYVLAVQDFTTPYISVGILNYEDLGIPGTSKYFNSGVLVINLEKWRSERIGAQTIEYLAKYKEFVRFWDQDGLNVILNGKWAELEPCWNRITHIHNYKSWQDSPLSKAAFDNALNHPCIIHFTTRFKPWNSYTHPDKHFFYKYLDMTDWAGWRFPVWKAIWQKLIRIIAEMQKV